MLAAQSGASVPAQCAACTSSGFSNLVVFPDVKIWNMRVHKTFAEGGKLHSAGEECNLAAEVVISESYCIIIVYMLRTSRRNPKGTRKSPKFIMYFWRQNLAVQICCLLDDFSFATISCFSFWLKAFCFFI